MADKLKHYRDKRDFGRTPEPAGDGGCGRAEAESAPRFVIQKHDASTLHYDFRLEVDGVLVSWAVPKGPSLDPRVRRLAIPTEDHPLGYIDFEGVIPAGEYGAGAVIVWDTGLYANPKERPIGEQIAAGQVEVVLAGRKLSGGFALIRTGKDAKARWLLIKMKDDYAAPGRSVTSDEPRSVLSGRTLAEVEEAAAAANVANGEKGTGPDPDPDQP